MPQTLLLVEDDPTQRHIHTLMLSKKLGYQVISAVHGRDALARVQQSNVGEISAVLLDIHMPEMNGFETLAALQKFRPDLPVIMLTSSNETEDAVHAMKAGASDFVVKPAEPAHLQVTIQNAIRLSTLARELQKAKRDREGALAFNDLVGHHAGLAQAVAYGRKAAASNVPVLLSGESGVGKELFARAIHGESKRVGGPFVAINCSAIPEHSAETALFSPEKGAFRKAEQGTIFLDDVGDLPQDAQVRLLRLLQYREIESSTGGKPIKVNVRVVAATERDLLRDVQAGQFREDLYFRLNILPIFLPPLRERTQDIVPLAQYFIERIAASEGVLSKHFDAEAVAYLLAQPWHGNVRELENVIHRALVLSDEKEVDAPLLQSIHDGSISAPAAAHHSTPPLHLNLRQPNGEFKPITTLELEAIHAVLQHFSGNITRAADALGMAKSTFYRKLKEAGIAL